MKARRVRPAWAGLVAAAVGVAGAVVVAQRSGAAPAAGPQAAAVTAGAPASGNGAAFSWGANDTGGTGNGTIGGYRTIPGPVSGLLSGVRQVARGGNLSVAVMTDGTVRTWGSPQGGPGLGDGTTATRADAVPVPGLRGIVQVSAGDGHVLLLDSGGHVWGWGDDGFSEFGDNAGGHPKAVPTPVQVPGVSGIRQVAAGSFYSLLLRQDGTVLGAGFNAFGVLGNGTAGGGSAFAPVLNLAGVTQLSAGGTHAMALTSDGRVWAWGNNSSGEIGNGTTTTALVPVAVPGLTGATSIAAGTNYSLAVANPSSSVWTWGSNQAQLAAGSAPGGQLGDGTTTDRHTPARTVPPLTGISQVAANRGSVEDTAYTNSAAVDRIGQLYTWGQTGPQGTPTVNPTRLTGIPPVQQVAVSETLLAVVANVTVPTPAAKTGTVGTALTPFTLTARPSATYAWAATGLPPGVTINAATGQISGTPTAAGSFVANVTATGDLGEGRTVAVFTITA